jgi:hypothetical protein
VGVYRTVAEAIAVASSSTRPASDGSQRIRNIPTVTVSRQPAFDVRANMELNPVLKSRRLYHLRTAIVLSLYVDKATS